MSVKKFVLRFLAAYGIAFVLVCLVPQHMHRRDFDKTFTTWLHDPTPQNEEALRREQHKTEIIKLEVSAVVAVVLVGLGARIYYGIRFARGKSNKISHVP